MLIMTKRNNNIKFGNYFHISPPTDSHLSLKRLNSNRSNRNKTQTKNGNTILKMKKSENYYIRPFELSVDIMQYIVNNGLLYKLSGDKQYLSIVNFPSVQIEQSEYTSHKGRNEGVFFDVYEDETLELSKEQLIANFENGKYINNIMVREKTTARKENNAANNAAKYTKKHSMQNIQYVNDIINSLDTGKYVCDLEGIDKDYIFIESINGDGKEYVIVGYPSARTMRQYLDLWKTPEFKDIHTHHNSEYIELLIELYNSVQKDDAQKIHNSDELYKFALGNRAFFYNTIIKSYEELVKNGKITPKDFEHFKNTFQQNYQNYFNEIGKKYLPKPITRIRYTFIILERYTNLETGITKLIPAIFNIRQLELKHLPILERINDIIKLKIPHKFGIIDDTDYAKGQKYELFNSYYKYVNFFHITTEYVHMMSNFTDYAHNLKDSITLEEIIYSVSREKDIGFPLFSKLRLDYKIRDYRILNSSEPEAKLSNNSISAVESTLKGSFKGGARGTVRKNYRNRHTQLGIGIGKMSRSAINKLDSEQINGIKILLMFEDVYSVYTFIYKNNKDGKFRKMKVKANLKNIEGDIIKYIELSAKTMKGKERIQTVYSCENEYIKLLQFPVSSNIKNFVILEDVEFTEADIRSVFMRGPIASKKLKQIIKENLLSIKYFYNTELLKDISPDLQIYNIYNEEPILIQNYKLTNEYKNKITGDCSRNKYNNNRNHFKDCVDILGLADCVINCIHFNVGKCGYDFIEIIDKKDEFATKQNNSSNSRKKETPKKTVYVLPTFGGAASYIGNFIDLSKEHLPMLQEIKKLYKKDDNSLCFLHRASTFPTFYCLHFHVVEYDLYNRKYPDTNIGTFIIEELHLEMIINILLNDVNYFRNYDINFLLNI